MIAVSDLTARWHVGRIHPTPDVEPEGWALERLCDIARLESGHTPSRNRPDYWDGGIPWLSLHDSKTIEGKVLQNTKMTISARGLANSSARLLPEGTVALSRTATIGKVALLGREMATSQDFACYICGPRLLNKYLAHLFRGMELEWERLMAGSTHNTIYMPTFENMQILVPPMEEQEAIADALSDADALIEGLERLIAKKWLIKQGTMQDLLTAKRRLPGYSAEWTMAKLGDFLSFKNGLNKAKAFFGHGTPIINYMDVFRGGAINEGSIDGLVEVTEAEQSAYGIRNGDVLFTRTSETPEEIGLAAVADGVLDGTVFSGFVLRGRPKSQALTIAFSKYCFRSGAVRRQIISRATYTTRALTNGRQLSAVDISVPRDADEQNAIAEVLNDMDAEIQALETRLDKARQVKEGMMQNLLTGRIRLV
ncbi:probable type I restriction-modification system protein, specificity subunit [Rhizobium etli CIAT 652]|uniref:Probable type I restriction-modification system protein, specificity subunit n=1 Tax=Rhizobium etli (strain CIAT 652) TaxID=491916 RepID=B3PQK6_RHIE6|nr:probable type I restriction-modification system protein, specificity subunit [Rhizobium etli CIAT 652]